MCHPIQHQHERERCQHRSLDIVDPGRLTQGGSYGWTPGFTDYRDDRVTLFATDLPSSATDPINPPNKIVGHEVGTEQMKTSTRLGTFDDVVNGFSKDVSEICRALRALITELHPDCVEVPRPGEPSASYGYGEKKMSEAYAYIMPQKNHANLGFYHGANIESEYPFLEGTGKKLRHIKLNDLEMVNSAEIRNVLLAAMKERRHALGV